MNNDLYIANSQIVFSFRRNFDIRKRIFDFEDQLKSDFKIPFRVIAIPDDLDPNIPRFESQSLHEHSHLQVSQTRITLSTNYNEDFKKNFNEVENYIDKKYKLLSSLTETESVDFIGIVLELGMYMEIEKINPFIKTNTGVTAINDDFIDFSLSYSKEYKGSFYLNIKNSKFTEQEHILHEETKSLRPTGNIKKGISVILDINTLPYFKKYQKFDKTLYSNIKTEVFTILKTKTIIDYLNGNL